MAAGRCVRWVSPLSRRAFDERALKVPQGSAIVCLGHACRHAQVLPCADSLVVLRADRVMHEVGANVDCTSNIRLQVRQRNTMNRLAPHNVLQTVDWTRIT